MSERPQSPSEEIGYDTTQPVHRQAQAAVTLLQADSEDSSNGWWRVWSELHCLPTEP